MPHATLLKFPGLGHAPQIQDPAAFHLALLQGLSALGDRPAAPR
jgi:pimeloyl-ACP methyl ester carboxylesterase